MRIFKFDVNIKLLNSRDDLVLNKEIIPLLISVTQKTLLGKEKLLLPETKQMFNILQSIYKSAWNDFPFEIGIPLESDEIIKIAEKYGFEIVLGYRQKTLVLKNVSSKHFNSILSKLYRDLRYEIEQENDSKKFFEHLKPFSAFKS